eukprot:CAMPEP_0201659230 /NCGR_PEP_ID=MMETSP0494-20130426/2056_1 /ASSEMBLY_ACC=CAM_ASM_000839 /TAXON_ID=420259 /ORGANISM="Thalassiosira gravida, Strain GMp14c1" /LENGTH=611 /DNA_ID=CAMNT_0048136641 /DNA_START=44 /DNA_END=1879 /DNA_ORIENTATION=-
MTATDPSPRPLTDADDGNTSSSKAPTPSKRAPRIIRRKKKGSSTAEDANANDIPAHIQNNTQLHHIISTTLPKDYEFEIPKTIWRIEKANATAVALQLPEGLLMYASTIGDILIKFAYRFQPPSSQPNQDGEGKKDKPKEIKSLSILGDVTYGACCIDDLSARALGCDLLVHYGHSCLVPLSCTVIPCLYVFVEIRVDVQHLVDCVKLTFSEEEKERQKVGNTGEGKNDPDGSDGTSDSAPTRIIEALVMGTVQFRSAVVESALRLNNSASAPEVTSPSLDQVQFQAIVPQAKPLSPGEVLGCTAPSGLARLDFQEALSKSRRRQARKNRDASTSDVTAPNESTARERVMIFLADGRFHLEAAMISNPSLRALRYDPYSKTLTEERYEIVKMKKLRRDAILSVRKNLGIAPPSRRMDIVSGTVDPATESSDDIANSVLQQQLSSPVLSLGSQPPSDSSPPITMGIILGTLGRQGNPAILSRIRSLLHSRGIRSIIVLLSEIFPKKLEMMSSTTPGSGGGVSAWVQIACPRLSIDWGHYFCVSVLSPFELYVALGEVVDTSLWSADEEKKDGAEGEDMHDDGYPMDFYTKSGGPWTNYYDSNKDRKVMSYGT